MSERSTPSEEILAYITNRITYAIKKYDKEMITPIREKIRDLMNLVEQLQHGVNELLGRVGAISKIEETAIYSATKAVADAKLETRLEELAERFAKELLEKLKIREGIESGIREMLPEVAKTVEKVRVKVDEKWLEAIIRSILSGFVEKEITPRISEVLTIRDAVKQLHESVEAMRQELIGLGGSVAKIHQNIDSIMRRVRRLEEEVARLSSSQPRREEAERGTGEVP